MNRNSESKRRHAVKEGIGQKVDGSLVALKHTVTNYELATVNYTRITGELVDALLQNWRMKYDMGETRAVAVKFSNIKEMDEEGTPSLRNTTRNSKGVRICNFSCATPLERHSSGRSLLGIPTRNLKIGSKLNLVTLLYLRSQKWSVLRPPAWELNRSECIFTVTTQNGPLFKLN